MKAPLQSKAKTSSSAPSTFAPVRRGLLQRKCACGGTPGRSGECEACREKKLQRHLGNQPDPSSIDRPLSAVSEGPPIAHEVVPSSGQRFDAQTPAFFKPRFGHDYSRVRVHSVPIQTKLTISQPGDPFEQEADRVAEQVMRVPQSVDVEGASTIISRPAISRWVGQSDANHIDRQTAEDEPANAETSSEEQLDESILLSLKGTSGSRHAPSPGVAAQIQSMHGGGQPLARELRDFFEPRFQRDFGQLRIHTDARAAQTTHALNARAYTLGRDIAFAPGEYRPETRAGRLLLAHELTHVVQQAGQVQTVMRACSCPAMGASNPTSSQDTFIRGAFPRLQTSDYCVTAPATPTYNCFAWSMNNTSSWLQSQIDSVYGNRNGSLEFSDFDSLYATAGLRPVIGSTPSNAEVALYATGTTPTHAARKTGAACGGFESKLGRFVRIAHSATQLEGGTLYGDINRYYVPS